MARTIAIVAVLVALILGSRWAFERFWGEEAAGQDLAAALEAEAETIGARLPVALDEVTTLTGVETDGTTIIYRARIAKPLHQIDMTAFEHGKKGVVAGNVCRNPDARALLQRGAVFRYEWVDTQGKAIGSVTLSATDCL